MKSDIAAVIIVGLMLTGMMYYIKTSLSEAKQRHNECRLACYNKSYPEYRISDGICYCYNRDKIERAWNEH